MEENNFFKIVWRFNGLLFAIVGILGIIVVSLAGYHMIKDVSKKRDVRNLVNVAEDGEKKESWSLGYMKKITGTEFVVIPLQSDQSYAQSYYSKSSYSIRNYLFINIKTNEKKWLFQTNKYLLTGLTILSEKDYSDEERTARAILYKIVKHDTNGDNRLTEKDKITIALSHPSGKNYKEILSEVDIFVGHSLLDQDTMLIIYQSENIGYSANVSLSDFTLFSKSKLPKIK